MAVNFTKIFIVEILHIKMSPNCVSHRPDIDNLNVVYHLFLKLAKGCFIFAACVSLALFFYCNMIITSLRYAVFTLYIQVEQLATYRASICLSEFIV